MASLLDDLLGNAPNVANAITAAAIQSVSIQTTLLPTITWSPQPTSSGQAQPAPTSSWNPLAWLAPQITITPAFGEPYVIAPWGAPTSNYFSYLLAGAAGFVGALAWLLGFSFVVKPALVSAAVLAAYGYVTNAQAQAQAATS